MLHSAKLISAITIKPGGSVIIERANFDFLIFDLDLHFSGGRAHVQLLTQPTAGVVVSFA